MSNARLRLALASGKELETMFPCPAPFFLRAWGRRGAPCPRSGPVEGVWGTGRFPQLEPRRSPHPSTLMGWRPTHER
jgi:hypothetical protein